MIRGKGSLVRHWPGRQWLSDDRFWGLAETPYFYKNPLHSHKTRLENEKGTNPQD